MRRRQPEPVKILHHPVGKCLAQNHRAVRRHITHQKARAGGRGKGHGGQHFRVIAAAGPHKGIGPAVIKNILAIGMMLQIMRHRPDQPSAGIAQHKMHRFPAAVAASGLAVFKGGQKTVTDKGVFRAGNSIPFGGGHAVD